MELTTLLVIIFLLYAWNKEREEDRKAADERTEEWIKRMDRNKELDKY